MEMNYRSRDLSAALPDVLEYEIEQLRQRVAELEKERDEALRVTFDPAVLEEMNKLTAERDAAIKLQDEANALLIEQARTNESLKQQRDELRQRVAELEAAVKKSNDRLNEERDIWDRMFGDGEKKLERIEIELDDCLYVLDALWNKEQDKSVTQKWAEILIRNKRATGASSAEDTCHPTTE